MALNVELYTQAELTKEIHRTDGPVELNEPINLFSEPQSEPKLETHTEPKLEEATSVGILTVEESSPEPVLGTFSASSMPLLEPSLVIEMPSADAFQGIEEPKGTEFQKHEVLAIEKKIEKKVETPKKIEVAQKIEDLIPKPVEKTGFFKQDNDLEILKNYLMLREQDLALAKSQNASLREELERTFEKLKSLENDNEHLVNELKTTTDSIRGIEKERISIEREISNEVDVISRELEMKNDRIKFLEENLRNAELEVEKTKDRVRLDIRKIRAREKELENKIEIMKKDSEILIASRESKILELKRKIDLIEFNYDVLLEKNDLEKQRIESIRNNESKVTSLLKEAIALIGAKEETKQKVEVTPQVKDELISVPLAEVAAVPVSNVVNMKQPEEKSIMMEAVEPEHNEFEKPLELDEIEIKIA